MRFIVTAPPLALLTSVFGLAAPSAAAPPPTPADELVGNPGVVEGVLPVRINEIRIDETPSPLDPNEYVELVGPPGAALAGLTYIVIGDGAGAVTGQIEVVISLAAQVIPADGSFVMAENTFTLAPRDFTVGGAAFNFENADTVTHLLVAGFTGALGQNLDPDFDGDLDVTPWMAVVDAVAVLGPGTDFPYGPTPGGACVASDQCQSVDPPGNPGHIFRCPDAVGGLAAAAWGPYHRYARGAQRLRLRRRDRGPRRDV